MVHNFLKKNWFLILLAMLATALGLLWAYLRLPKPEKPIPPPQAIETPSSRFSQKPIGVIYTISAPPPQVPDKATVFEVERFSETSLPPYLQLLFPEFGIPTSSPPRTPRENILIWDGPSFSLTLDLPSGNFDLYNGTLKVASSFSLEEAKQYTAEKARSLGLIEGVASVSVRGFVPTGPEYEEVPLEKAGIFAVTATASINGLPLVSVSQSQNHVEFWLTKEGSVTKIGYHMPRPGTSLGNFSVKSWANAVAELQAGEAKSLFVKDAQGNTPAPLSVEPLKTALITKSYLAYFDSGDNQTTLQPVFVFEGTGTTTTGEARTFALYVSAIDTGP